MKQKHETWSRLVLLGSASIEAGNFTEAIRCYQRARTLADRLIDDTIVSFDGDTSSLTMYVDSCRGLVQTHQRAGDSAAARLCLEQTAQRLLAVMKNTGYPLLMRGKMIRAFEPLFNLTIQFYQTEGRPSDALAWIRTWLTEVQQQVARMRPVQETVLMN